MRFALKTAPENTPWEDMLAMWRAADDIELFESAWSFDHFEPIYGERSDPCLEGWTTLAALAQATERIRVGVLVTGTPYRHPAVLANMAAAVDIVSGGRLELGLGAGWNDIEANAYGIDLLPIGPRMDRFDEACDVIVGLLSEPEFSYQGTHFQLDGAHCEPKPAQRPHPSASPAAARSARCAPSRGWPSTGTTWAARSRSSCGCGACSTPTARTWGASRARS
jgi:alkanesulfonate monooxygenase SsuD/methylene tetrahydromethanopterin reductase-like flavin-dependent oxidoreductase (luciferase family)